MRVNEHLLIPIIQYALRNQDVFGNLLKKANVSSWGHVYGLSPRELKELSLNLYAHTVSLVKQNALTWEDVLMGSDIFMERLMVTEVAKVTPGERLLDVGCGRGYFMAAASYKGARVVGIDLAEASGRPGWLEGVIDLLKKLGASVNTSVIGGDAVNPPLRKGLFDAVALVHLAQHVGIEGLRNVVEAVAPLLRVGGRVIIAGSVPMPLNIAQENHLMLHRLKCVCVAGEYPYPTETDVRNILKKAGLKVTQSSLLNTRLAANPPLFYPGRKCRSIIKEYQTTIMKILRHGEESLPTLVTTAKKS